MPCSSGVPPILPLGLSTPVGLVGPRLKLCRASRCPSSALGLASLAEELRRELGVVAAVGAAAVVRLLGWVKLAVLGCKHGMNLRLCIVANLYA